MLHLYSTHHSTVYHQVDYDRHVLLLIIAIQMALIARSCHAEIACYTNGESTNVLTQEFGTNGLGQCTSPTSKCYESVGETSIGVPIQHALYRSGCTPCPTSRTFKYDCQVCDTPLCNNQRALKIQSNNIVCYVGTKKPGSVFGTRTIFCTDGVEHCFYTEYLDHFTQKKQYQAGCGQGAPGCWNCKSCKGSLCNIPDELKGTVKSLTNESTAGSDVDPKNADPKSSDDDADSTSEDEESKKASKTGKKSGRKKGTRSKKTPDAEDRKSSDLDSSSGSQPTQAFSLTALGSVTFLVTSSLTSFGLRHIS